MIIQGSPVENHPMPAPKLSVITITYKDPDGFAATIDSLRPLTRENFGRPWEFIVIDSSPSENAASVARLTEEGVVLLAGPTLGIVNIGVTVFEAEDEAAAWAFVNADPTVAEGHVTAELHPFRASFVRRVSA